MNSPNRLVAWLLFAAGLVIGWQPQVGGAQTELEQRRQQLEALSPSEKRDLIAKKERFDRLSREEQERLRKLDEQLQEHPESEEMQQVLQRYGQ